jgi:hypothetical protein
MRDRLAIFEACLVRETLRHYYGVDDLAALPATLPPHAMWQSPLVVLAPDADALEAAQLAGRLWMRNLDLSLHDELVLVHERAPFTLVCQRPRRAGEQGRLIGPLARAFALPGGVRLGASPLVFQERSRSPQGDPP